MIDARDDHRKEQRKKMAALNGAAIEALVRRGYAVRGKTTSQIREILRHRPTLRVVTSPP
ncbi:MAG: hypothetical protein Q7T81_06870 [Pseudolabrys sp.]|nr:hypothetical protein [Pseudolabrys sp.]